MKYAVVDVKAIYFRNNPIVLGAPPRKPPYDYSYHRCPIRAAMIWDAMEKAGIQGVTLWCHEAGFFSRVSNVVSVKQGYPGHAKEATYIAAQCKPGFIAGKFELVVDDEIDITSLYDVIRQYAPERIR